MVTPDEYARYIQNLTAARVRKQREDNSSEVDHSRKSPEPQHGLSSQSLDKNENEESHSNRIKIFYRVFRSRLCDPDNIFLKYHTDALRYEKLIKDDRYQDIEIEVEQFKSKEERVEITIIYP